MAFAFTPAHNQPYTPGSLFLGRDPDTGLEVGINTDRHICTFAGARSGKGAALIIPNLKRWPHNAIVVDPKGENAEHTWKDREALGQTVHVLDPFKVANVPDRLRGSINPLDSLDPSDPLYAEDVGVVADGLVMRHDPKHAHWDNGGRDIIEGLIDYVVNYAPPEFRTLPEVRRLLTLPRKLESKGPDDVPDDMVTLFTRLSQLDDCPAARAAATVAQGDLEKPGGLISNAQDNTKWLDSAPIASVLGGSSFKLSELKNGKTTVFIVLPPNYLKRHGRFLRLFVRAALDVMAKGGQKGARCLFILDEFYSLGRIDEIATAAGLMPSYGVHLWPFLQDLGQLQELYGEQGAMTFFGNSDAHIFFALTDPVTLDHVSRRLDKITPSEIGVEPPVKRMVDFPDEVTNFAFSPVAQPSGFPSFGGKHAGKVAILGFGVSMAQRVFYQDNLERQARVRHLMEREQQRQAHDDENERRKYDHAMRSIGQPRLAPLEVRELVAKKDEHSVANSMIVFGKGSDVFNLSLAPYFVPYEAPIIISDAEIKAREVQRNRIIYAHEWYLREYDNQRLKLAKKAIPGAMAMGAIGGFFVGVLISSSLSGGFFFAGLAGCLLGWIASFDTADERKRAPRLYQQIMEDAANLTENNALPTIEEMTAMRKLFPLNQRDTWEYGPFDPAAPRPSWPLIRPLDYPEKFAENAESIPRSGASMRWTPAYDQTINKSGG